MNNLFDDIETYRKQNLDLVIVTVVEKSGSGPLNIGKKMIVTEDGKTSGTIGGGAIELFALQKALKVIKARKSATDRYCLSENDDVIPLDGEQKLNMTCGGHATLFYEFVGPRAHVYIFGGGHCGHAIANVLKPLGFYITVIDRRQEILDSINTADQKVNDDFLKFIDKNGLKENSIVIVSTPTHEEDYRVLDEIIKRKFKLMYFGMLCSRKKISEYLDKLYQTEKNPDLANFYSPIGLKFGENSPEDIAISVAAEILEVVSGVKKSQHLRESLDEAHRYWEK